MILGLILVMGLPYYQEVTLTPMWPDDQLEVSHRIGSFELKNQEGNVFSDRDLEGKIHVAGFFFTTCGGICGSLRENLRMVYEAFPNDPDVFVLFYSAMPEYDQVDVLARYGKRFDIDEKRWQLLTGDKRIIYQLARESYFADGKTEVNTFLHTEKFLLVDRQGYLRGVYNGTSRYEMTQLIEDLKALKRSK